MQSKMCGNNISGIVSRPCILCSFGLRVDLRPVDALCIPVFAYSARITIISDLFSLSFLKTIP